MAVANTDVRLEFATYQKAYTFSDCMTEGEGQFSILSVLTFFELTVIGSFPT